MYAKVKDLPQCLQNALNNVGYCKPDIEIEAAESYCLNPGTAFSGNRGYVCAVNLETGDYKSVVGAWGGSNPFENTIDRDNSDRPILANMAIIKGESGGRGHYARIKVAPLTLAKFLSTPQMELSDNEKIVLACMKRLKSSYRLHEAQRVGVAEPSYYAALATLKEKKLVKISSNGAAQITTEGKNALSGVKMPDKARFLL
jgi:hypothetical protein